MADESSPGLVRPCVFISAVSRELADARLLVANCLRVFHNVDVYYQEEFGMEPGELLAMLRTKIDESAGVLQLVGEAYGAAPPDEDPEFGPVSFTQYEFLYAQKQGKVTWLIDVEGACTRAINVAEFVFPARPDPRSMELERRYLSRLRGATPGGQLAARAGDDDDLKQVIAEHTRRRQLQQNYAARNHAHVRGRADNDDQLVDIVRVLQRVPHVAPRSGFATAHLGAALHERFVGRAALTYAVLFLLRQPGSARQRIVLYGLDGSGKTTVATEIGHVYHKTGHDVLVVRPGPGRDLNGDIAPLAEPLGLPDTAGAPRVREWLRRNADWLMIFDGVDDVETAGRVEQFCSQFHDGHFLITSSLAGYWGSRQQFVTREVDTLGTPAAHRLLLDLLSRGSRPPDPAEALLTLTRLLDGLPLAILHANGYLERNPGHSIKAYIARLQSAPVLPDSGPDSFSAPLRPIAATWQASVQRLRPSSRTLLRLMSFLTDHPVPLDLIKSPEVATVFARACAADPLERQDAPRAPVTDNTAAVEELWGAIRELLAYSLIRWYDVSRTHVRVHRLVLRMTQGSLRTVSAEMLPRGLELQQALASLEHTAPLDPHRQFMAHAIRFLADYLAREGTAGRFQIYPHLFQLASLYLAQEADGSAPPLPLTADELNFLGETLSLNGKDKDAVVHFARAAAMPHATAYDRAKANQGLAWSLFGQDRIKDALDCYRVAEQALTGQPNDGRHDDIRYEIYSGRGWLSRFVGDLPSAIRDLERALALARQADDQRQIADAAVNLGGAYDYAGDSAAAAPCYREAVDRADSSGDPYIQGIARYLIGWFLIRHGSRDEGMALCREAMTLGDRFEFGTVREEAAWIMAVGCALAGDSPSALEMADAAVQGSSRFVVGWEHLIRGIMRFRVHRGDAAEDFRTAIAHSEASIARFEHFDPLDTLAFSHAGLALLGQEWHVELAVRAYQQARALAPAAGIVAIGRTVFSCFGSNPAVTSLAERLFPELS